MVHKDLLATRRLRYSVAALACIAGAGMAGAMPISSAEEIAAVQGMTDIPAWLMDAICSDQGVAAIPQWMQSSPSSHAMAIPAALSFLKLGSLPLIGAGSGVSLIAVFAILRRRRRNPAPAATDRNEAVLSVMCAVARATGHVNALDLARRFETVTGGTVDPDEVNARLADAYVDPSDAPIDLLSPELPEGERRLIMQAALSAGWVDETFEDSALTLIGKLADRLALGPEEVAEVFEAMPEPQAA